jgi:phage head maturation protease
MVPIGVPRLLEQQERGLYSETEYLENPLASSVLDAVKKGAVRGYSFYGNWIKSQRTPAASRGQLPTIHRSEIAMREYGPGLFPVHPGAQIVGTRTETLFLDELRRQIESEDYDAARQLLGVPTPLEPGSLTTPDGAGHTEDDPASRQSSPSPVNLRAQIRARNRIRRIA